MDYVQTGLTITPHISYTVENILCRDRATQVAEGLSEEELKYRMLADSPASDDWLRQEMTMRKRAVQWQYKRKSAAQKPQAREEQPPPPPPPR